MGGDSEQGKIAHFKAITKTPECALATLLLLHVTIYSLERSLIEGATVSDIAHTLWSALWTFADNPIVRFLMIPLAVWLFARGVQRVERTQKEEAAKRAAIEARETVIRSQALTEIENLLQSSFGQFKESLQGSISEFRDALRDSTALPNLMAQKVLEEEHYKQAKSVLECCKQQIATVRKMVEGAEESGRFVPPDGDFPLASAGSQLKDLFPSLAAEPPPWGSPPLNRHSDGIRYVCETSNNQHYLDAVSAFAAAWESYLIQVDQERRALAKEIHDLRLAVKTEMERLHAPWYAKYL